MERAVAPLIPFVREWELQLNPEHLYALAGAVLEHYDTGESWEELEAAVHAQIADFKRRREAIEASYRQKLRPTD
jgi:hypothetical protein